ncbi:hypothetical protein DET65_0360 [Sunxiuqinia elliptica]|uniref:Uncharacterized protein n=1 Tax=Sunxiuqinia elliptica TaxID=655355 RepID=A0A1I2HSX4_9BACT|nr:hypothetical protein DET52_10940 [Sunxiuqinia elliptica]TDO66993.1 hypothetical protein DET65_0360 [Sunxiuqinia elliptica]SFF31501.1 hypothetical protein SAMN05216283_104188 [Sunxiuqinia elliptica]
MYFVISHTILKMVIYDERQNFYGKISAIQV